MRVLVDTCIIIDALQSRVPFAEAAQKIFIYTANKQFEDISQQNPLRLKLLFVQRWTIL